MWKKSPRGFFAAIMRSSIGPDGPAIVIVSARGDFGAAGNAPMPAMRRARISWIVKPAGSALSRRTISSLTARVSAGIAAGSNTAGSIEKSGDMRRGNSVKVTHHQIVSADAGLGLELFACRTVKKTLDSYGASPETRPDRVSPSRHPRACRHGGSHGGYARLVR